MNHPIMFLYRGNKTKLVQAFFLPHKVLIREKESLAQSVVLITFTISLCIIKKLIKLFYLLSFCKKGAGKLN